MTTEEPKFYTPAQVAKRLGISVQSLKYHRARGHIQGTPIPNTNMYVFTEEQVRNANLTPRKPGPRIRKKDDEQEGSSAGQQWDSSAAGALLTLARAG